MNLKLIILFIIMSSVSFSASLEFDFGIGAGTSIEFSYADNPYDKKKDRGISESGSRTDNGSLLSVFLDIGANFELQNAGALNSISVLFETGGTVYMRVRTRYKEYPQFKHRFTYHNLILGILPKLNFDYGISLGIGTGIFLPLYSESSKRENETDNGLPSYGKKFDFKKISYMYKVPVMPYIKLSLEKNFYMSERWAFKIGADLLYNFGMEFDLDKWKSDISIYDKYNFSSLAFEVFLGFGFGRPR